MRKLSNKWLSIVTIALLLFQFFLVPIQSAFANEVDVSTILSPDGEIKTQEIEEALKNGVNQTIKVGGSVVYRGQVQYGGSVVGDFTVDGVQAFCVEHDKPTPPTGTPNDGGSIYSNKKIAATLYWGWGGTKNMFSNRSQGIVVTSLVLSNIYSGTTNGQNLSGFAELRAKAMAEDVTDDSKSFSKTNATSSISGEVQKSETIKLNADKENRFSFSIPSKVIFHNVTTGVTVTGGTATIKGGDSFYLTAPLDYNTNYSSGNLYGSLKEYFPILYAMTNSSLQKLVVGVSRDPQQAISFNVNFEARMGALEITKRGSDGKLLANAEYQVKNSSGSVAATVKTGSNGKGKATNLPIGEYTVVEKKAPAGYTLDSTPRKVTVNAGQTATLTVTNKQAFFQVRIKKQDSETGDKPQGEATLVGAKYGIYSDQAATKLIEEVTIGSDLTALSKQIPLDGSSRTVYVKEIKAPTGYELDKTVYSVKVDQTNATTEVFVGNVTVKDDIIKGKIVITKKGNLPLEDGGEKPLLAGAEYRILDINNKEVARVVTNAQGQAVTPLLPYGKYTVEEVKAPEGYTVSSGFEVVNITDGSDQSVVFENKEVLGQITITKHDSETGSTPQGEATFEGAVYEVFDINGKLADTLTIKDGSSITKKLRLGKYTIKEKTPPTGYLLNDAVYNVELTYAGQTVELVSTSQIVKDDVIKGKISIVKIGDMNVFGRILEFFTGKSSGEKPLLEGAELTVYDKDGKVADKIVTDEKGRAETKMLPYGTYTVSETKVPIGYKAIDDFEVTISEHNKEYFYVLEDEAIKSELKIVKIDTETGKKVPVAGITFKIKNVATGEWVEQTVTYPSKETISEFKTAEDGTVHLPEPLVYGKYEIHEISAPSGYVLSKNLIPFTVDETTAKDGVTIEIQFGNEAQKGTVNINKIGEDANSVTSQTTEYGELFEFNFGKTALAGATFDLIAKEDITTPDGTIRYQKGDVVDTVTSEADGTVKTKAVYLGKYKLVEIKTPSGHVSTNKEYDVELTYSGQEVSITSTSIEIKNELQGLLIQVHKMDEQVVEWKDGQVVVQQVPSNNKVFGLFMKEEMQVGNDVLPADSLVGLAKTKEGLANFESQLAEGIYYVQEVDSGNEHVLDETKHEFEYKYDNNDAIQEIHIFKDKVVIGKLDENQYYQEIENELVKVNVKLVKVDDETEEHDIPLAGVPFKLVQTIGDEQEVVGEYKTDDNGGIEVIVPVGDYHFEEIEPLYGYQANEDDLSFTVNKDDNGETIEIKAINKRIPPKIGTTATIQEDGSKETDALKEITIVDTVDYEWLIPRKEYTMQGILMDKETGEPLLVNGKEVTAETTFTPEESHGTVELTFTFDASSLQGKDIVVFEDLYRNDKLVTSHTDIEDEGQTVTVTDPEVQTTATNKEDGSQIFDPEEKITIQDKVEYTDLIEGKEYTIKGILMDKATNEPLLVDEKEVTAEKTFIAESKNGSVTLDFTFNASELEGKTIVVFEDLYRNNTLIASHADINDKGQTVYVTDPELHTTATNKNGGKTIDLGKNVVIQDKVEYENLIPGKTYTIEGKLMDKVTNKPLLVNGKEVTAKKTFVAKKANDSITLEFKFDSTKLAGKEIVVFEDLYRNDTLIASHADINDKGQTVQVVEEKILPQAGDTLTGILLITGAGLLVGGVVMYVIRRKKNKEA